MQLHRWKAAEAVLATGVEQRPGGVVAIPQYLMMLGICRYYLGDDAAAERDLASVRNSVDTPLLPYYLGRIAERRGNALAACRLYDDTLRRQPGFLPAAYQAARVRWRTGDMAGARATAETFQHETPEDPEARLLQVSLRGDGPPEREFLVLPR